MRTLTHLIALAFLLLCRPAISGEVSGPFVLVSTNTEIHRFSLQGEHLGVWVARGSDHLNAPQHMALGPDGNVYVANYFGGVEVFTIDGGHVRSLDAGDELVNPAWLGFRDDTLIVSALGSSRVLGYNVLDNDEALKDPVTIPNGLSAPHGIVEFGGETYVSLNPGVVARFDTTGEHLGNLVTTGLARPLTILPSADASQLIVTNFNGQVMRYDAATGASLGRFTSDAGGSGSDGLNRLPSGNLIIAFNRSRFVKEYTPEGELVGIWGDASWTDQRPNAMLIVPSPATVLALPVSLALRRPRRTHPR